MTTSLSSAELLELRTFALELADVADQISLPIFGGEFVVDTKDDGTPVTIADRSVEERLRQRIAARYPDHAVLGEEEGLVGSADAPLWVIDPIDGTKNFASGNPVWATLIALVVDDVEQVAVVSAPALGSRWDGIRGGPARQDGTPVTVSTRRTLADAEISFGGLSYFVERGLGDGVLRLSATTRRQRGFGDFWHHCLVASGIIDVALEAAVSRWDLAAVKCIVEAAGGRFSALDGRVTADGGDACSSNALVHDEVLATLLG